MEGKKSGGLSKQLKWIPKDGCTSHTHSHLTYQIESASQVWISSPEGFPFKRPGNQFLKQNGDLFLCESKEALSVSFGVGEKNLFYCHL